MPFSEGKMYHCRVDPEGGFGKTPQSRMLYFRVDMTVVGGDMAGSTIDAMFFWTKKNRKNLVRQFAVLGITSQQLNDGLFLRTLGKEISGKECAVVVGLGKYRGEVQVRANDVLPVSDMTEGGYEAEAALVFSAPDEAEEDGQEEGPF